MRHLLMRAVNPLFSLLDSLRHWKDIAHRLHEPPRHRTYRINCMKKWLALMERSPHRSATRR